MNLTLSVTSVPTVRPVIQAPPSKSDAIRLLFLSALSVPQKAPVFLRCPTSNADLDAAVSCFSALGCDITKQTDGFRILPHPLRANNGGEAVLNVGESASVLRFLLPVLGAFGISACIRMEGRLPNRPLAPLDRVLCQHGMELMRDADPSLLHVRGQLTPGAYAIDGSVSSQFLTGLLFALPLLAKKSTLTVAGEIASAPYVQMTEQAMRRCGVCPAWNADTRTYTISPAAYRANAFRSAEGDYSGAAFFLCAGAILPCGCTVTGLSPDSVQGDRKMLSLLRQSGCTVTEAQNSVQIIPPADGILRPFSVNLNDTPDLLPPAAMLAAAAAGTSVLSGCARLRLKESDRLHAAEALLTALGGQARAGEDTLTVMGNGHLRGGCCDGASDHRIVMSALPAALLSSAPVTVTDAEAVRKSYPRFFEDCARCGISARSAD